MIANRFLPIALVSVVIAVADLAVAQTPPGDFNPPSFAADTGNFDPPPDISPNAERWRYCFQNGCWWYFTPNRRWLYWSQGRWVEYLPPGRSNTPPYIQPPVTQRPHRWRPMGIWGYRSYPPAMPYQNTAPYFAQPGLGAY